MKEYLDNPRELLAMLFVGGCFGYIAYRVLEIFSISYEEIQRKNQTPQQDETPMTHFISPEALRNMQKWLALCLVAMGAFYVSLSHNLASILLFGLLAIIAWFAPPQYYAWKVRKRQEDFEEHMLEFVMLLSSALQGGLSIQFAIETTSKAIGGSVEEEFVRVWKEYSRGLNFDDALSRINNRINCENLKLFTVAVTMTMQTGGDMKTILNNIAETIRKREEFDRSVRISIAKIKQDATIIVIAIIAFILYVSVTQRKIYSVLLNDPRGRLILFISILGIVISFLYLKKLTNIKI